MQAGNNRWRIRVVWLGREDSNLRMAESKSAALPLGYAPAGSGSLQGWPRAMWRNIPASAGPRNRRAGARLRPGIALAGPGFGGYNAASNWKRSVAQPGSAPRSGRGGRRFESSHSDQCENTTAPCGSRRAGSRVFFRPATRENAAETAGRHSQTRRADFVSWRDIPCFRCLICGSGFRRRERGESRRQ